MPAKAQAVLACVDNAQEKPKLATAQLVSQYESFRERHSRPNTAATLSASEQPQRPLYILEQIKGKSLLAASAIRRTEAGPRLCCLPPAEH